ncbi:MAG: glycosyltransferase family 4 protein [Candidatus Methylomirabilales bacterium]
MGYLAPLAMPFGVGLGVTLCLTPLCRWLAERLDVVDRPGGRKIHGEPTPLLGGVAIALATCAGVLAAGPPDPSARALLGAGLGAMLLGVYDDKQPRLGPPAWWLKLLLEAALALVVVQAGVRLSFLPPWLALPVTLFWMLGITNAFNLLDNMNGLSAGIAGISALTFGVLAARYLALGPEQLPTATLAAAVAGACLGFLPANFRSRIFMGDAGSLFLGFSLAGLAVLGSWRSPTVTTSVIIPLLVLAYPIFDTTLVVWLRLLCGRSPVVGARDHSSHRLVRLGLGRVETVVLIYLFAVSHALTAVIVSSVTFRLSLLALAGSAAVLFIFGMVLRKAPPWEGQEEASDRGQEAG